MSSPEPEVRIAFITAPDLETGGGIARALVGERLEEPVSVEIRDEAGTAVETSLWTGCYTPRELRLLCAAHGLRVDSISSVEPGAYGLGRPTVDSAELLVLATRP